MEDVELRLFLHGDEKVISQKHADLFAAHLFVHVVINHLDDDEEVRLVRLRLRTLAGIEHIFQGEWMQLKSIAKQPERFDITEAIDVCLLYTSDAADERSSVDLGGRRII